MNLKKIKIDRCPYCGSDATLEERIKCGPDKNSVTENKSFECGFDITSMSGDSNVIIVKPCPNSKSFKLIQTKRLEALKNLYKFIDSMSVDDNFKNNIKNILMREISSDDERKRL